MTAASENRAQKKKKKVWPAATRNRVRRDIWCPVTRLPSEMSRKRI